jgi:DNA-binding GntR family transcriptional regulator
VEPLGDHARSSIVSTLKKVVLRDQVKEFILERILTGTYAPGRRLVETQIARELECSQAPVREALRDLEQLGCVHYEPNRGCSVRAFSEADLARAYPVRAVLEALAAGGGLRASALDKALLRDQIKDHILERIVTGTYAPGQRLVETQIARELKCSQAPVREALRDLEQLGCVHYEPNRGCSVRAVSEEELLEAYPVRAVLEALAAEQAASRITDEELDELDSLFAEMCDGADREDDHDQARANLAFHGCIVQAARNRTLQRQWTLLEPFARTYLTIAKSHVDRRALAERHRPILEALRARDPQAASEAMRTHLLEAGGLVQTQRATSGSDPDSPGQTPGVRR